MRTSGKLLFIFAFFIAFFTQAQDTPSIVEGMFQVDTSNKIILVNQDLSGINTIENDDVFTGIILDTEYELEESVSEFEYGLAYDVVRISNNISYTLYFTQLPIISITTTETIKDEPKVPAMFHMSESDQTIVSSLIGVEYRGGFTQSLPKKSLRVEFREDSLGLETKDVSLAGFREDDDWNLDAILNEPIRINTKVSFELWNRMDTLYYAAEEPKAINGVRVKYVEVFLKGKYRGVYALTERVDRKQLKLKKFKNDSIRGELYKGKTHDARLYSAPNYNNNSAMYSGYELKYPKPEEAIDWANLHEFADFIVNSNSGDFLANYQDYFNLDNAVNYFIFINLMAAWDNTGKNTFIAKYKENEPYFYVPWDLDGTFGINWDGDHFTLTIGILTNGFYNRLIQDNSPGGFVEKVKSKWAYLRQNVITHENITNLFLENINYLKENGVYAREYKTWANNGNYTYPTGDPTDFIDGEFNYMSGWLTDRLNYLDLYFSCDDCGELELDTNPFVTVWKTNNPGESESNQIKVPAVGGFYYSWVGLDDNYNPTESSGTGLGYDEEIISFPEAGMYQLSIYPDGNEAFSRIKFNNEGDKDKLLRIEQWGDIEWSNFKNAYYGAGNLQISAVDLPNLSNVTNMEWAFANTPIDYILNMNDWDMSTITDTHSMFRDCPLFNEDLSDWDVSNVTDMYNMFRGTGAFNQPIGNWDVSQVTDMHNMFREAAAFDQPLENWNVENVEDFHGMFREGVFNQPIGNWDTSSGLLMQNMFRENEFFNQPLNDWDVSYVTEIEDIFRGTSSFDQYLGDWDFSGLEILKMSLANTSVSCENYSLTLQGWVNNPNTPENINFKATGLSYSSDNAVTDARNFLVEDLEWNITGDEEGECTFIVCNTPEEINVENITHNSVQISWLAGEETEWEIIYAAEYFDPNEENDYNSVTTDENPFVITGLTPETDYTFYIRALCIENHLSNWTENEEFTTDIQPCDVPLEVAVTVLNHFSAEVSWEAQNEETEWEIIYGFQGFNPDSDEGEFTSVITEENPYLMNDLEAETDYQVYIRALCTENNIGEWTDSIAFTTEMLPCDAPLNLTAAEATYFSVLLSWEAQNDETQWEILYGIPTFDPYEDYDNVEKIIVEESFYVLDELEPETEYQVYVRAICAENNASNWTDPVVFITEDLSLDEFNFETLVFYPNPFENELNLTSEIPIESIRIFDTRGKELLFTQPQNTQVKLDMQSFSVDIYFMTISIEGKQKTYKLVKK